MAEAIKPHPTDAVPNQSSGAGTAPTWDHGPIDYAPGVIVYRKRHRDEYFGLADALIAAGLCRADQFPGLPGRNINSCTYWPDGTPKRTGGARPVEGTLTILRARSHQYQCRIARVRTGEELEYWKRKDDEDQARHVEEMQRLESESNANATMREAPKTRDDYWYAEFDGASDAFIAGCIQSNLDTGAAMRRAAQEIFKNRRKAQSRIANSEGNVIFPKCWTRDGTSGD